MKDTFYFSHDYNARHDPKLVTLQMEYGLSGLGLFWCLVEMLFEQGGYLPTEYERIAFELRTDANAVRWIVNESGLFQISDNNFYSNSVLERLNIRTDKSRKASESANKRWEKQKGNANAMQTHNEGNAIKERKGKEIKGNEKKEKKKFIPPSEVEVIDYFLQNGFDAQLAKRAFNHYNEADWIDTTGKPVLSWKQKMQIWFKPENKKQIEEPVRKLKYL
jgi:hypothetical protein